MVRILPNGDIVQDGDARVPRANTGSSPSQRQGSIRHEDNGQQGPGGYQGGLGNASIFDSLNEKLLSGGIPRWNAGPYVVEPIVSVGFLLALVLIGIHGLIFAALLFFISKYSTQGWSSPDTRHGSQMPRSRGFGGGGGGGGQRLGR